MAENKYIDELTELTSPERAADWIVVEDVSAGETKKIKYGTVCAGSETALTVASLTLVAGATVSELSIDGTMAGNSDTAVPTEKAVATYVGSIISTDGTMADNSDSVVPTEKAVVAYVGGARTMASLTLAAGATVTEFSTDGTMGDNSDAAVPTEKALVTYVAGARTMASLTLAAGATVTEFSTDGTMADNSDTAAPTEKAVVTYLASYSTTATTNTLVDRAGRAGRPTFTYNGGSTAYTVKAKGAVYWCKDKLCHWDSELTTTAISTPVASTWYYLYLDYSAITEGTAVTATELIWSSTAPTYSNTYSQWMNGDDRCVFAVLTNGTPTNILEFFHDGGDLVLFADAIADNTSVNVTTSFADASAVSRPTFCSKIRATFVGTYVSASSTLYVRPNGSAGTSGILIGGAYSGATVIVNTAAVFLDSTGIFEWKEGTASNNTFSQYTDGWYFPGGM